MNTDERIQYLCDELQVMAFNLADELDNINFHSTREAVRDMERTVFKSAVAIRKLIRDLVLNLDKAGREADMEEPREMYRMMETVCKCSNEHVSFKNFIDDLIPLMALLSKWGDRGPIAGGESENGS